MKPKAIYDKNGSIIRISYDTENNKSEKHIKPNPKKKKHIVIISMMNSAKQNSHTADADKSGYRTRFTKSIASRLHHKEQIINKLKKNRKKKTK